MRDVKYIVGEPGGIPRRKEMDKTKIKWLAAESFTRSRDGKGGARLEQGKVYDAEVFDPEVVAEWVRAGAAEYTGGTKLVKEA